jgi:hypothetical protein
MDPLSTLRQLWDRALAWVAIGIGALVLLLGWLGVSGEVLPAGQIPYVISGGLGGLFLLGVGAVLLISADLRDEWSQLREIATKLDIQDNGHDPPPGRSTAQPPGDERLQDNGGDGPRHRPPRRRIAPPVGDPETVGETVDDPWQDPHHRAPEPLRSRPLRARRTAPKP